MQRSFLVQSIDVILVEADNDKLPLPYHYLHGTIPEIVGYLDSMSDRLRYILRECFGLWYCREHDRIHYDLDWFAAIDQIIKQILKGESGPSYIWKIMELAPGDINFSGTDIIAAMGLIKFFDKQVSIVERVKPCKN